MRKLKIVFLAAVFTMVLGVSTFPAYALVYDPPPGIPLIAGKHINVGRIMIRNSNVSLDVRIETGPDWRIAEIHLDIATSLGGIPQTKSGNPIPGQFQYTNDTLRSVSSYKFTIPMSLAEWPVNTTLYIAAHCAVSRVDENCGQSESAWAGNLPFPGSNWATYTTYLVKKPMGYA